MAGELTDTRRPGRSGHYRRAGARGAGVHTAGSFGGRYLDYPGAGAFRALGPGGAAADGGGVREPAPCSWRDAGPFARGDDEQRQHHQDEGTGQERHRRVEPDDRRHDPGRGPYPVGANRDRELRLPERRAESAAGFLAQPPDHRPALPGG